MKLSYVLKNIVKKINNMFFTQADIDEKLNNASTYSSIYTPSDYVIEEGSSDIWTYRKWASGFAECWGVKTYTLSSAGTVWVSPDYYYEVTTVNYPFTFTSVPIETVTPVRSSANAYWLYKGDGTGADNTTTHTARYGAIKINSFDSGSTITLSFNVVGMLSDRLVSLSTFTATIVDTELATQNYSNLGGITYNGVNYGVTTAEGTEFTFTPGDILSIFMNGPNAYIQIDDTIVSQGSSNTYSYVLPSSNIEISILILIPQQPNRIIINTVS